MPLKAALPMPLTAALPMSLSAALGHPGGPPGTGPVGSVFEALFKPLSGAFFGSLSTGFIGAAGASLSGSLTFPLKLLLSLGGGSFDRAIKPACAIRTLAGPLGQGGAGRQSQQTSETQAETQAEKQAKARLSARPSGFVRPLRVGRRRGRQSRGRENGLVRGGGQDAGSHGEISSFWYDHLVWLFWSRCFVLVFLGSRAKSAALRKASVATSALLCPPSPAARVHGVASGKPSRSGEGCRTEHAARIPVLAFFLMALLLMALLLMRFCGEA